MRLLAFLLANLWWVVRAVLGAPFALLRRRSAPRWVRVKLKGDLPYRSNRRRKGASLDRLARLLDRIATDKRVTGVLLQVEPLGLSSAKRDAIGAVLEKFRASGKKLYGHAVVAGNAEYALLCACERIVMPSAGRLDLVGFAAEATAIGGLLEKVGITAEFFRRGDYKTAPELFTHKGVTDIQRKTLEGLLDERYADLVAMIAKGRRLSPDDARRRIDEGPYSAKRARTAGLIDEVASLFELEKRLADEAKKPREKAVGSVARYERAGFRPRPAIRARRGPVIDLVRLRGMIVHGEGSPLPLGPRSAGSEPVVRALQDAAQGPGDAAILFVDSPGGSALASELILEEAQRLAEEKPLIVYVEQVAASGGYMAALAGKEVWASPHAIVGSIGVFGGKFEISGLLDRLGVGRLQLTRGAHAGLYSSSRPFSDDERRAMDEEIEETYQSFLAHVAKARKQSVEWVHARAEGRVYSGRRAIEQGLIDRLGGFEEASARALELAGRPGQPEYVVHTGARGRAAWLDTVLPSRRPEVFALWEPYLVFPELWRAADVHRPERRLESFMKDWMHAHLTSD
jgi:protease-4